MEAQKIKTQLNKKFPTIDASNLTAVVAEGAALVEREYGHLKGTAKKERLTNILGDLLSSMEVGDERSENVKDTLTTLIPTAIDTIVMVSKGAYAINEFVRRSGCC